MSDRNYKDDVKVDFQALEENYRDQSEIYMHWGEKWANARKDRRKKRRELLIAIKQDPSAFDLPTNPSNVAIDKAIQMNEEFITCQYDEDLYEVAKTAIEHRRSALNGLIQLHNIGYISDLKIPESAIDTLGRDERQKEHVDTLNQNVKLKRRLEKNEDTNPS